MLDREAFLDRVAGGRVPPLYTEIPFAEPAAYYPSVSGSLSALLESGKGPEATARYSFIAFDPWASLRVKDGSGAIELGGNASPISGDPLDAIEELLRAYPQERDPELPPLQGGALAIFSYDFVRYIEDIPAQSRDDLGIPDAHVLMVDRLIAFDHMLRRAWIVVCPGARDMISGKTPEAWAAAYDQALGDLGALRERINTTEVRFSGAARRNARSEIVAETPEDIYTSMVLKAKEYIAAGDIFQANISLRVTARLSAIAPWDMYLVLRGINPSPFGGFLDMGDYQIVSSSPERLVMVRDGTVETRPIAGTRPRGRTSDEDASLRDELLLNEKERAEHIMLIDLERNDLGRVAAYGTVEVNELMTTEEYSHVIHIVSNVRGTLAPGKTCLDALRATFPGGTITGVPKIRCMQIIDELEPTRRGPYTGSMGYIGYDSCMDLNIIIRTFTVKDGLAHVQAGAGIVADSDPAREYRESLKKAEALLATLGRLSGDGT